jgi:hypothetical protein
MDDTSIETKLAALEGKIDAIYTSVEKTRKYFLWTLIITLAVVVLPLLFLPFAVSSFLKTLTLPAGF